MQFAEIKRKIAIVCKANDALDVESSENHISVVSNGREIVRIDYGPTDWYIYIADADTSFWNSGENYDLALLLEATCSYLRGYWKSRKTILGKKEICLKVTNGWLCTKKRGNHTYHYTKMRKEI